jgi:arylformamidase
MPETFDRAALDAEFRLDAVADLEAVFARRARATAAADRDLKSVRNIAYGQGEHETFDLFPAPSAEPAPVQVFIHGGFWSSLAAADFSFVAPGFVPFGASVAIIDYPLIPSVGLGDIVACCLRCIHYLQHRGAEHGIDPKRIFVSGNSAGGHLVVELMDRIRLGAAGLPADTIKGGTAISGLYDLTPVAASFRNDTLELSEEDVAAYSPLLRKTGIAASLIVSVGGDESRTFLDQSAALAARLGQDGAAVEHIVVPDTNHITVVLEAFANPDAPLNRAVRRQMGLG